MKKFAVRLFFVVITNFLVFCSVGWADDVGVDPKADVHGFAGVHESLWDLKAHDPLLIGGYGDNFSYDGSRVTPVLGRAAAILDADKNTGTAIATIKGTIFPEKDKVYSGKIMLVFRVGMAKAPYQEGGVADFVYLHGNTKQDAPVMPKSRTYLGAWGMADVYVNGEQIYKDLMGHVMYTERARNLKTYAIYNKDKSGFFSPKNPENGSIAAPDETELHFVAHSMKKDKGNSPPHAVWLHLNFGKVVDRSASTGGLKGAFCKLGQQGGKASCGAGGCRLGQQGGKASCGPGCKCGCETGGPCAMPDGNCGPGCPCGCNTGASCVAKGGSCGSSCSCGCASGGSCAMPGGSCGAKCACGCNAAGKTCNMAPIGKDYRCGSSCGCGCVSGGPCSCF